MKVFDIFKKKKTEGQAEDGPQSKKKTKPFVDETDPREEIESELEEHLISTEEVNMKLSDFGDVFPEIEIEPLTQDNLILYITELKKIDGQRKSFSVKIEHQEEWFPVNRDMLEASLGPGTFFLKLYKRGEKDPKKKWLFNKQFVFGAEEMPEDVAGMVEHKANEAANQETEKAENTLLKEEIIKLHEEVKELGDSKGKTFQQELILTLLKDHNKSGRGELNEALLSSFASVKTAEITSVAETTKAQINANTALARMKVELEKAKLNIKDPLGEPPNDLKDNPKESKEGLGAVVDGVNKFVNGMNAFMDNLTTIIDKAQEKQKGRPTGDDIQDAVDKIVAETTGIGEQN